LSASPAVNRLKLDDEVVNGATKKLDIDEENRGEQER
jgi:hypothetical protein